MKTELFTPIEVRLEDLLLDPNNPRLIRTVDEGSAIPDSNIEQMQDEILQRFDPDGNLDCIDTSDLDASMRRLGYVGIDQVVVRKLQQSPKYVVVEGNRRVSTLKRLVQEFDGGFGTDLGEDVVKTFRRLRVMQLLTDGVSQQELQHRISVILGLRHHGSLLEWEPLPKAHNIYIHYMALQAPGTPFRWEPDRGREVESILSIKKNEVRQSLRTYVAYLQLKERMRINSEYYSLIQAGVTNRNLTGYKYLEIDETSFRLDGESFERLVNICQFPRRASLPSNQIIIPRPQLFSQLGQIVERANRAKQHTVRALAAGLLEQIESGALNEQQSLETPVESAWAELKAFEEGIEWVSSLNDLLSRQSEELPFETYVGVGNDRRAKDQLSVLLKRFQAILSSSVK